jgi:2,5-diketo-D-gluconate reductase A
MAIDRSSTVRLRSGAEMPLLGLGTWQLTRDTAGAVRQALELGYRMIDTSGDYGTQPGVGDGFRRSGMPRDEVFIVTKVEEYEDAYEATVRDLDELGLESADLMLIHRPPRRGAGVDLWEGLLRAQQEGLAREVGVSNYRIDQIDELVRATGETPAVNQIEWSPFGWSPEVLEESRERGIVIQGWSPLTRTKRLADQTVSEIADAHGVTAAQVLLRWSLQLGSVPLPKATGMGHQAENLGAFELELADEEMDRLGQLNEEYSALGGLSYLPRVRAATPS